MLESMHACVYIRMTCIHMMHPSLLHVCTFVLSVLVYTFFWDSGGSWSTEGCEVVPTNDPTKTECSCNHLTNFAILMSPAPAVSSTCLMPGLGLIT